MLLRHRGAGVDFLEAKAEDIDLQKKVITLSDCSNVPTEKPRKVPFDTLVVTVGATSATFGTPGVRENAHFLKEIPDALRIRTKIIDAFESANISEDTKEIDRLLHFVVVGGGPTGVEFAAELRDFIYEEVTHLYPRVVARARVTLINAMGHLLNTYDVRISEYCAKTFGRNEINVLKNTLVTAVGEKELTVKDVQNPEKTTTIPFSVCVWAAGLAPQDFTCKISEKLGDAQKRKGLLETDEYLRVLGAEDYMYALGDCSSVRRPEISKVAKELFEECDTDKNGTVDFSEFRRALEILNKKYPQVDYTMEKAKDEFMREAFKKVGKEAGSSDGLTPDELQDCLAKIEGELKSFPATAQVASQEGEWLAKRFKGRDQKPFRFHDKGIMAYVGGARAVIQSDVPSTIPFIGKTRAILSGMTVLYLWRGIYFSKMVSLRCKHLTFWDWVKAKVYGRDVSRL
uniref:EF-hand domain-containing protein n=1 Tax=Chromera velia CCMP2878 TaxID=1169474 RepID=A0A0G4FCK7_9ALVE|eukprot:Cvel_3201.t1-p1 / transcript=Cvel_3201.t1 / gene=Cvel_3201 / organism=Chromera_velia_CCMP2878 / gene_product=NAD(P)H dehydrogenase B2, mitochondrial, putative / transcript_product=NAD(P)H dehydrogenase B2, mitochondrial, putative / location=Cvel_scaffold125:28907-32875(+) / protein_length=457 / sequence_SO=supercontig / SO=protein_coding / is_pseudo=false